MTTSLSWGSLASSLQDSLGYQNSILNETNLLDVAPTSENGLSQETSAWNQITQLLSAAGASKAGIDTDSPVFQSFLTQVQANLAAVCQNVTVQVQQPDGTWANLLSYDVTDGGTGIPVANYQGALTFQDYLTGNYSSVLASPPGVPIQGYLEAPEVDWNLWDQVWPSSFGDYQAAGKMRLNLPPNFLAPLLQWMKD